MSALIAVKNRDGVREIATESALYLNRVIWLSGDINNKSAIEIIQALMTLDKEKQEEITIYISSPGGSVNDGLAIYDVMRMMKSPIRTVAVGMVASMAAIIFSSGTKGRREVMPSAKVMIHDPRIIGGREVMSASQIVELGVDMQKTKQFLNAIIAENTGRKLDDVNRDTLIDNYMSAEEALEYGLADKICERL